MKKSKISEDQIAFALKQAELGTAVDEVCRKMGISEATFYLWRKKYQNLGPTRSGAWTSWPMHALTAASCAC
jgi:putative transposase